MTTFEQAVELRDNPAKFSKAVLAALQDIVQDEAEERQSMLRVFDPFAGTGRVHELASTFGVKSVGIELEPEWAGHHPATIIGDANDMVDILGGRSQDVMVTSPVYPNRMTDHHNAQDRKKCRACVRGILPGGLTCQECAGSGRLDELTDRMTYKAKLGRDTSPGSSCTLSWNLSNKGRAYREFHARIWSLALRVLVPRGLMVVNVSNHLETIKGTTSKHEHRVVEFHLNELMALGCTVERVEQVKTPRSRRGANYDVRVDAERILVMRAPGPR